MAVLGGGAVPVNPALGFAAAAAEGARLYVGVAGMSAAPSIGGILPAAMQGAGEDRRAGGFRAAVGFARSVSLHPARWSGSAKYTARDASIPRALAPFYRARLLERCFWPRAR